MLHYGALYGIIELTKTTHHPTGGVSYAQHCASRRVRDGRIELLEPVDLPEGTTVLVTPLIEEDTLFWARVSHIALDAVWNNAEDDVYAQLLQE